jgi:hypothetical protein
MEAAKETAGRRSKRQRRIDARLQASTDPNAAESADATEETTDEA